MKRMKSSITSALSMRIHCDVPLVEPRHPSVRVREVAAMFGLALPSESQNDKSVRTVASPCTIDVPPVGTVFFNGPSGAGKSTALRNLAVQLEAGGRRVVHAAGLSRASPLTPASGSVAALDPGVAVVDSFRGDLKSILNRLALVGLADARLAMQPLATLSAGQQARLAIAHAIAHATSCSSADDCSNAEEGSSAEGSSVIVIDEFASLLDRLTAAVLARSMSRIARRHGVLFLLASAHDDIVRHLQPDVLITCELSGTMEALQADPQSTEANV